MGMQKIWVDPEAITALPCGTCSGTPEQIVKCQMESFRYQVTVTTNGDYTPGTYDQAIRGLLAEGRTVLLCLASPAASAGCAAVDYTDSNGNAHDDAKRLTEGIYLWIQNNLPPGSLNRIVWTWINEPDIVLGRTNFGPWLNGIDGVLDGLDNVAGAGNYIAIGPEVSRAAYVTSNLATRLAVMNQWVANAGDGRLAYNSYHALYTSQGGFAGETEFYHQQVPATLGATAGRPLFCTEWLDDSFFPGCSYDSSFSCFGANGDCSHNSLAGFLSESRALLYTTHDRFAEWGTRFLVAVSRGNV